MSVHAENRGWEPDVFQGRVLVKDSMGSVDPWRVYADSNGAKLKRRVARVLYQLRARRRVRK